MTTFLQFLTATGLSVALGVLVGSARTTLTFIEMFLCFALAVGLYEPAFEALYGYMIPPVLAAILSLMLPLVISNFVLMCWEVPRAGS